MKSLYVVKRSYCKRKVNLTENKSVPFEIFQIYTKNFTKMFQTCQNQPDFGSTKPKCATLKKKFKVFCFSVLIFLEQSVLPDISLYVSNKNNLTVSNNFADYGIFLRNFRYFWKLI